MPGSRIMNVNLSLTMVPKILKPFTARRNVEKYNLTVVVAASAIPQPSTFNITSAPKKDFEVVLWAILASTFEVPLTGSRQNSARIFFKATFEITLQRWEQQAFSTLYHHHQWA